MLITITSVKGGIGKTTIAIHVAALLAQRGQTLLIDGDPNGSALQWSKRGDLPFQACSLMAAPKHTRSAEHCIFDTAARPSISDLEALIDGCDLLVIPCVPSILSIEATIATVGILQSLKCNHYRILLSIVPSGRKTGVQAREALAEYPMFAQNIRAYAAYEKAAIEGKLVYEVKDRNAKIAWRDFVALGKELLP